MKSWTSFWCLLRLFLLLLLLAQSVFAASPASTPPAIPVATAATGLSHSEIAADTPTPPYGTPVPSQLLNISTRLRVGTEDNVLIGGFIITGNGSKQVIIRGLGPSLPLGDSVDPLLADPVVELHFPDGSILTNDNWTDNDASDLSLLSSVQLTPSSDSESALVATLNPGAYTVVLHGKGMDTGIGLVEVFDLNASAGSQAANISGRGLVEAGDDVMIGGFIVGPAFAAPATIVIRALGPSLSQQSVSNPLSDPHVELYDSNGIILSENDNWADGPDAATISSLGLAPAASAESALFFDAVPGAYTAVVTAADGGTGIALVEIYSVQLP
jgi:hypothetical protein